MKLIIPRFRTTTNYVFFAGERGIYRVFFHDDSRLYRGEGDVER
jgi:hypothetical protein